MLDRNNSLILDGYTFKVKSTRLKVKSFLNIYIVRQKNQLCSKSFFFFCIFRQRRKSLYLQTFFDVLIYESEYTFTICFANYVLIFFHIIIAIVRLKNIFFVFLDKGGTYLCLSTFLIGYFSK